MVLAWRVGAWRRDGNGGDASSPYIYRTTLTTISLSTLLLPFSMWRGMRRVTCAARGALALFCNNGVRVAAAAALAQAGHGGAFATCGARRARHMTLRDVTTYA